MSPPKFLLATCRLVCFVASHPEYISDDELQAAINQANGVLADNKAEAPGAREERNPMDPDDAEVLIIDARRKVEYTQSHIRDAVSICDISTKDLRRLRHKDRLVVTYCAIGLRSGFLRRKLEKHYGFTNVCVLKTGYYSWANDGRPIYNHKGPATHVMPQHFIAAPFVDADIRQKDYGFWTWSKADFRDRRAARKEAKLARKLKAKELKRRQKRAMRSIGYRPWFPDRTVVVRTVKTRRVIKADQFAKPQVLRSSRDKHDAMQLP